MYFILTAAIAHKRKTIGIGVFFCILGTMHFLETYLAAVFFIELPFGLISPGSTVMFAGKLALFLLLYIKEDAESMRQPTYGLLAGNLLVVALALILRLHSSPASLPGYNPDLRFLDQMGLLMVWGTTLLFVDLIALVVIYERLGTLLTKTVPGRIFASLAIVLSFDQLLFYAGLHLVTGVPLSALYGGWVAKMGSAAFFTFMLTLYLRHVETDALRAPAHAASDVFDEADLPPPLRAAGQAGRPRRPDRPARPGQFDAKGPAMLKLVARSGVPVSLMMIDIDRFKEINDRYGHPVGIASSATSWRRSPGSSASATTCSATAARSSRCSARACRPTRCRRWPGASSPPWLARRIRIWRSR